VVFTHLFKSFSLLPVNNFVQFLLWSYHPLWLLWTTNLGLLRVEPCPSLHLCCLSKNKFRNLSKHICLLTFPFFIEISVGNHLCQLGFFPPNLKALLACDQVNRLSEEIGATFSSNQGSRKVKAWEPSSLINPWSVDHIFQILGIEKRATKVSVKSFAKFSSLQSHRHGQFSQLLDPILFSVMMVRRRSIALPSLFPWPRSRRRDLTDRPLSSPVWQPPDRSASPYPRRLGWPLRSVELKKGKPSRGVAIAKSHLLSNLLVSPLLFSLRLVLANPPLAHLCCCPAHWPSKLFHHLHRRPTEEVGRRPKRNPSSIVDHASVHGDVRVSPLDACSDVPLHRRWSLSSFSFPCTHPSPASSWTVLRQW
jgi:hypothetical protein